MANHFHLPVSYISEQTTDLIGPYQGLRRQQPIMVALPPCCLLRVYVVLRSLVSMETKTQAVSCGNVATITVLKERGRSTMA